MLFFNKYIFLCLKVYYNNFINIFIWEMYFNFDRVLVNLSYILNSLLYKNGVCCLIIVKVCYNWYIVIVINWEYLVMFCNYIFL